MAGAIVTGFLPKNVWQTHILCAASISPNTAQLIAELLNVWAVCQNMPHMPHYQGVATTTAFA